MPRRMWKAEKAKYMIDYEKFIEQQTGEDKGVEKEVTKVIQTNERFF